MKIFCIYLAIPLCLFPVMASAQSFEDYKRQQQAKYNSFVNKAKEDYRSYRDRVNAEYADFMRRAWTREEAQPAIPLPKRPEPPQPVMRNPLDIPKFEPISFGEVLDNKLPDLSKAVPVIPIDDLERLVITAPEKEKPNANVNPNDNKVPREKVRPKDEKPKEDNPMDVKPKDETPLKKPSKPVSEGLKFVWCGQTWQIPLESQLRFRLRSAQESDVADAWKTLSGAQYAGVIAACLKTRDAYQLSDWGYLHFLEAMAEAFLPGQPNEARLLEMFILVQSGYKVRIARCNERLYLLVPSRGDIFEYSFIRMGGLKYYITDKSSRKGSFYIFERDFPREQPFVWQMSEIPRLESDGKTRTLQGQRYAQTRATVNISKGLIEFMNKYPRCNDWNSYATASLSEQAKNSLYPALRQHINGKSKNEAVDILLDFVQTAFAYQTDEQQFGQERPLFGDETLYYPYCDCEDRSILFSILVRELVGLDVVLLDYPNHLATAVRFDGDVQGDYLILDGSRYVVCDPTYFGSHVGEAMPSMKKEKARVIKL